MSFKEKPKGDGTKGPHEASWLALEVAKVRMALGVKPLWSLTQSVQIIMHWYRQMHSGADTLALCQADIAAYEVASEYGRTP